VSEAYRVGISDLTSEIATLKEFILKRLSDRTLPRPGLILIDGGRAHMNAALSTMAKLSFEDVPVIGAVKPPGKHDEISHFLTSSVERVDFDPSSPSMRVLKQLRDEAHDLANAAHRKSRDMAHFYELAEILPSLNEKERQGLTARLGSIRKILEADEGTIIDMVGADRASAILTDLENFRNGNAKDLRPLIVPIRYDDPNGQAADLRPISTVNR
jgi:excinuclease ABC subunit C